MSLAYSKEVLSTEKGRISANIHQIRAISNSLAFFNGSSMEQVMVAGCWKVPTTFIDYYLRDMSVTSLGLSRLGPIVAGQRVI